MIRGQVSTVVPRKHDPTFVLCRRFPSESIGIWDNRQMPRKNRFYVPTLEMMRSPITGFANFLFKFCCFPGFCVRLLLFLILSGDSGISPVWQNTNFKPVTSLPS